MKKTPKTSAKKAKVAATAKSMPKKKAAPRKKATMAAADPNPTGRCTWTNSAGQIQCRDGLTKTQCAKIPNSVFTPGGVCL